MSIVSTVKKLKLNEGILAALYSLYQDEAISYKQIRNSGFSFTGISGLDRNWNPIVLGYVLIKIDNYNFKIEKWKHKNS
ncbi:hypothetical protein SAMN06298216_1731 [Spirosomataceae bacterium TFI 002]|nr:hypothetical protein SAMN06298216_1731 [Spirosomataceae bacterium TFI 002]